MRPERADLRPERAGLRLERADSRSECADLRPEKRGIRKRILTCAELKGDQLTDHQTKRVV